MLALLLTLAWAPMMAHCTLETIPGLQFLRCGSDAQPAAHCDGVSCCAAESGDCQAPSHQQVFPVLAIVSLSFDLVANPEYSRLAQLGLAPPNSAPPELSTAWQFISRAAPPCRAPSLVS
jgi:hypothetical protein